ncbi:replication initiation protein [Peribacillus kribbensis]|uniref:replication initiation protein n=1 Tax=Peribacillus kribbensis TaxID=356658 RepID=UPI0004034BBB|nr:replication initiation protein [Peribacillus kribbensis]
MSVATAETSEQLSFELLEEAEIKPYYWVNQSNDLINARQDLTLTERRIIYALVSLVQPEDIDFKTYVIQIKELANLIGVSETSFYERVEKAVDGLQSKVFIIEEPEQAGKNGSIVHKINWIQQATYLKGEGLIRIKLSDTLADYLMNLKKYTGYQLFNVLQLKSEYSWRIYELLKEREPWVKRIIKVSELRKLLNIPDDKLTLMKNFRKIVLDKAKEEIEEKTDITFHYEIHKKIGRKIDSFVFYISKNDKITDKHLTEEAVDYDIQILLNRLIANGVRRDKATNFIKHYHPRYIEENIVYVMRNSSNDVSNLAGYIVKAIENNYADSPYEVEEYESSLYRLRIGNYDNKVRERTKKDIADLETIYEYFQTIMQKERPSSIEDINLISDEREKKLFDKINAVQKYRHDRKLPPLTTDDVEESKIKMFFKKWKESKDEIPY